MWCVDPPYLRCRVAAPWEDDGKGIGGGFDINPDALLQFIDPHTVHHVFIADSGDVEEVRIATRRQRMLRRLLEDTVLLYGDLHPEDADYARAQRSSLVTAVTEMTGGTVEIRAEGMLLRLPEDSPAGLVVAFPGSRRSSWFALNILDAVIAAGPPPDAVGRVAVASAVVDERIADVAARYAEALTDELRGGVSRLRAAVEPILQSVGLVRINPSREWIVQPIAARYRNPRVSFQPVLAADLGESAPEPMITFEMDDNR
ncbi:DUF2398 family protein [Saccharopolyspora sp. ASAGF58]|uniref:DUF2398 family protein n=1 Tax=Saccharopolyspora sp. ASAGF58 TaxID=2719023 RepID=UPI001448A215|nr:DUF2398 family protein [Saccharopolyspora sp. ASAGF58]